MAEVEVGGVTFKGGKAFGIILAIGSMIGALYGAFEVYKTYEDMKEAISLYEAPALSGIEAGKREDGTHESDEQLARYVKELVS